MQRCNTDATSAWPSSCRVKRGTISFCLSTLGCLNPFVTRSVASSTSHASITSPPRLTDIAAASLQMFASSAPDKPGRFFANCSVSMLGSTFRFARWICKIFARASMPGAGTVTLRSNRPGRIKAGSSRSARFVAPTKTTPVSGVNPSISVKS